jgi:hypothetical protein
MATRYATKVAQLAMAAGAGVGLWSAAAQGAHARHAAGLAPYATAGLTGSIAGLVVAVLLLVAWRVLRGGRTPGPPAAGREAIPERVRHEVWRRDQGTCVDCGSRARLELDHIIPVVHGGANTVRNLEIRCEACNRSKGARI